MWCTQRTRNHARAEWEVGFSTAGAAWALKPLRTDFVSRGLFISLFTRATIFLSISIRPFFLMKRPSFERRAANYRIEFGVDLPSASPQLGSSGICTYSSRSRVSCATANIPSPRHRAAKEPLERSILLTCCDLICKRKRTRPCNDCPTSSLHMILRVASDACLITMDQHVREYRQR